MKKAPVIHPFLFAIYPILFLFSQNIAQVSLSEIWVPMGITLSATFILFFLIALIFRDIQKAGIITAIFLVLVFSYGHLSKLISLWGIGSPIYLLLIDCLVIAVGVYFLKKIQKHLHKITNILNVFASLLIILSLVSIGAFVLKTDTFLQSTVRSKNIEGDLTKTDKADRHPSIYYIILDAYARQDVLMEVFDYDNQNFINYLVSKGFYVADRSLANYCFTQPSLASSLNSCYLDKLTEYAGADNRSFFPILNNIWYNATSEFLEQQGYKTKYIYTAGSRLQRPEAPEFYTLKRTHKWLTDAFYEMVIRSTPIPYFFGSRLNKEFDEFDFHRKQVLYAFDKIVELSRNEGPLFIFAHIIKPHLPFVFSEKGKPIAPHRNYGLWYSVKKGMDRDEYIDLYRKQLSFINKKVMIMIEEILSNSPDPPIIIVQSDHGPTLGEDANLASANMQILLPILNALYLPHGGKKYLYPTISPVNTFRVILNHYFDIDLNLLPDKSYCGQSKYPYRYYDVSEKVNEKG